MSNKNRTVIFAHYDHNDKIEDYVVYYMQELKKIANNIIFVSDSNVSETELIKIENVVTHSIVGHHGMYDFGSYKKGFLYAKENDLLNDIDELVFANDSCYGPLYQFEDMFNEMSNRGIDFWGVTMNPKGFTIDPDKNISYKQDLPHIQSYFLVFKPQVFNSNIFIDFIKSIKKEHRKEEVIANYEINLTQILAKKEFKYDVYCDLSRTREAAHLCCCRELVKDNKSPLIKRNIFLYKNTISHIYPFHLKSFLHKYTNYNYDLILKDQIDNGKKVRFVKKIQYYLIFLKKNFIKIHFKDREIYIFNKLYKF